MAGAGPMKHDPSRREWLFKSAGGCSACLPNPAVCTPGPPTARAWRPIRLVSSSAATPPMAAMYPRPIPLMPAIRTPGSATWPP